MGEVNKTSHTIVEATLHEKSNGAGEGEKAASEMRQGVMRPHAPQGKD